MEAEKRTIFSINNVGTVRYLYRKKNLIGSFLHTTQKTKQNKTKPTASSEFLGLNVKEEKFLKRHTKSINHKENN